MAPAAYGRAVAAGANRTVEIGRQPGRLVLAVAAAVTVAVGVLAVATRLPRSEAARTTDTATPAEAPVPIVSSPPHDRSGPGSTASGEAEVPAGWLHWSEQTSYLSVRYPESWRVIDPVSMDEGPAGALVRLVLATRDVAVHNGRCSDVLGVDGLGPTDALVAVYEVEAAGPAPVGELGSFTPPARPGCPDLASRWDFTRFASTGREFAVFAPVGREASQAVRDEARTIIASLTGDAGSGPCTFRWNEGHVSMRPHGQHGPRLALVAGPRLFTWDVAACDLSVRRVPSPGRPLASHVAPLGGEVVISSGSGGPATAVPTGGKGPQRQIGVADSLVADGEHVWLVVGELATSYPGGRQQDAASVSATVAPAPSLVFGDRTVTGVEWAGTTLPVTLGPGQRLPPDLWMTPAGDPATGDIYLAVEVSRAERRILRLPAGGGEPVVVASMSRFAGDMPALLVLGAGHD